MVFCCIERDSNADCIKLIVKDVRPEMVWPIMDHDPARFYAKGNVVMIGDAAHVCAFYALREGANRSFRRQVHS